jgi:16S rRNA processing protein RimM
MDTNLYTVGKVVNTHGIKGEVKVITQTDFPDVRFAKGSSLLLFDPQPATTVAVAVEHARQHKNSYIVKFAGLDHINEVEKYKGWLLKVTEQDLVPLAEDEYYYHEIVGCTVTTEDGDELGQISEVLSPGANDVWVVNRPKGKPVLIPVIDDVVLDVDISRKMVQIRLMEGLLD